MVWKCIPDRGNSQLKYYSAPPSLHGSLPSSPLFLLNPRPSLTWTWTLERSKPAPLTRKCMPACLGLRTGFALDSGAQTWSADMFPPSPHRAAAWLLAGGPTDAVGTHGLFSCRQKETRTSFPSLAGSVWAQLMTTGLALGDLCPRPEAATGFLSDPGQMVMSYLYLFFCHQLPLISLLGTAGWMCEAASKSRQQ